MKRLTRSMPAVWHGGQPRAAEGAKWRALRGAPTGEAGRWRLPEWRNLRPLAWSFGALAIVVLVGAWFLTFGTWRFFVYENFGQVFDAQANSWRKGRWDLPPAAISGEAFLRDGKRYTYFGVFPAIVRAGLNPVVPILAGKWSRVSVLFAIAVSGVCIRMFLWLFAWSGRPPDVPEPAAAAFMLCSCLGSSLIFLASSAFTYHEAIAWGSALAMLSYCGFGLYLKAPRVIFLLAGCAFGAASFFSRPVSGSGPILTAALLGALLTGWFPTISQRLRLTEFPRPMRAAALALATVLLSLAGYVGINRAKFGTTLDGMPLRMNIQYSPQRLANIDGTLFHPSYAPKLFATYVAAPDIRFRPSFPWLMFDAPADFEREMHPDILEAHSGFLAVMPLMVLLGIAGCAAMIRMPEWRPFLLLLAPALASGSLIFIVAVVSHRYLHDMFPALAIASAAGFVVLAGGWPARARWLALSVAALLGMWSIYANLALTLTFQREISWATSLEHKVAFSKWRQRFDQDLFGIPYQPMALTGPEIIPAMLPGQILFVPGTETRYRFDGARFLHLSGPKLHEFEMRVEFEAAQPGTSRPLWFAGSGGFWDAVRVVHLADAKVRFCFERRGGGGSCGKPVSIRAGRSYPVRVWADRLGQRLQVEFNSDIVLALDTPFQWWTDKDVRFGRSPLRKDLDKGFAIVEAPADGPVRLSEADGN